jgi:putative hemolysin
MPSQRQIARDISYAYSAQTRGGRTLIKLMENASGRVSLIKRACGYEDEVANGGDFWQVMDQRYGLNLDIVSGSLDNIPCDKPLIMIANHPYGILDGLMMGYILKHTRGDFRILAHKVFRRAEDLNRVILPISFDETKEAVKLNLETRKVALDYLNKGGAIGIFPGGTVSTAAKPFAHPMDPAWRSFTARLIAKSGATVVPLFFDGANSSLFQYASRLHYNLRMGLLIKEFRAGVDTCVRVVIGEPIDPSEMKAREKDARALMDYLRQSTYKLSPTPLKSLDYGFEFEEKHKP